MNRHYSSFSSLAFALIILLFWELGTRYLHVPTYVLPSISTIAAVFANHWEIIGANAYTTAIEALFGCALACMFGVVVGVAMAEIKVLARVLLPYIVGSNAVPIVAIAPLMTLWLGHGILSRSMVAAFLSFFPITINVFQGLSTNNPIIRELFQVLGASRREYFLKYKLINALPFVFSGLKVSATLSVIGAVVAEFVSPESGLGFGMIQATYSLDTPRLFAYLCVACLMGLVMYGLGVLSELLWWRGRGRPDV